MCLIELSLKKSKSFSSYWHFNVKLLHDVKFCENFVLLWNKWKERKNYYENILQWWEVGKTQIRMFCQDYTAHTNSLIKKTIRELERDIEPLEVNVVNNNLTDANRLEKQNL